MDSKLNNTVIVNEIFKTLRRNKKINLKELEEELRYSSNTELSKSFKERSIKENMKHLELICSDMPYSGVQTTYNPNNDLSLSTIEIEPLQNTIDRILERSNNEIKDDIKYEIESLKKPLSLDDFFEKLSHTYKINSFFTTDLYDRVSKRAVLEEVLRKHSKGVHAIGGAQVYKHGEDYYVYKNSKLLKEDEKARFNMYLLNVVDSYDGISFQEIVNIVTKNKEYSHFLYDHFGRSKLDYIRDFLSKSGLIFKDNHFYSKESDKNKISKSLITETLYKHKGTMTFSQLSHTMSNSEEDDNILRAYLKDLIEDDDSEVTAVEIKNSDTKVFNHYYHKNNFSHLTDNEDYLLKIVKDRIVEYLDNEGKPKRVVEIVNAIEDPINEILDIEYNHYFEIYYKLVELVFKRHISQESEFEDLGMITIDKKQLYFTTKNIEDIDSIFDQSATSLQDEGGENDHTLLNNEYIDNNFDDHCIYCQTKMEQKYQPSKSIEFEKFRSDTLDLIQKYRENINLLQFTEADLVRLSRDDLNKYVEYWRRISEIS